MSSVVVDTVHCHLHRVSTLLLFEERVVSQLFSRVALKEQAKSQEPNSQASPVLYS